MTAAELVVLCAEDGRAIGTADKRTVHDATTALHLAFSCYVFDPDGRVLVTRRAWTKATWPGVRTNSCCGHPAPGEPMTAAVRRRLERELGITGARIDLLLPGFRYRSEADGVVENELCPVYRAVVTGTALAPDPAEVARAWWEPWPDFVAPASTAELSPWSVLQLDELRDLGADPLRWAVGDPRGLPTAALR